jgi:hypothetical protein
MADKTVTLTHPDVEKPIEVPADEADKYVHGGWSVAVDKKSTTTK